MGLSYSDLNLLRFVQRRQKISLSKAALQFEKDEISIRRTVDRINLFSSKPLVEIKKGFCLSRLSYKEFVDFIQQITMEDYASSYIERIRVMIVTIFFHGYVNASSLYENWGISLTTKKQDTAYLRKLLEEHGLKLLTLKKKGLTIEGDELQLRFLVLNILHPLLEFTAENRIEARYANTPLEKQSYHLANAYLQPVSTQAVNQLTSFLTEYRLSLNYPSKKFLLLFICIMEIRPVSQAMEFSYRLPLAPLNIHCTDKPLENKLYNVVLSMMNFSRSPDFPMDNRLRHTTEQFTEQVVNHLKNPFTLQEEFIQELYSYFYREITLNHFHCTFVDKTVENTREQFSDLYETIRKYEVYFKAAYNFSFMDEHLSTLTVLVQKHILRNRTVSRHHKKIVVMTSINFERVSFFLELIKEYVELQWMGTLNINEIHELKDLDYDYIFCFSSRIYNMLHGQNLPVIHINFFVGSSDVEKLLTYGFSTRKHRFPAARFVSEIGGKSEAEMEAYLKENYGDHFV
ncbi:helix-turn-helix domain-containing protein [Lacrimispora sp.]|uniref:helix-turn-helix domain-containing protein n=1 Tax=Lacrimispora sp. TaxID=2719234 RepID=UPI00345FFC0F